MENRDTFQTVLREYRDAYIRAGMGQQGGDAALMDIQNRILMKLGQLKQQVDGESQEIRDFSKTIPSTKENTEMLAAGARTMESEIRQEEDERTRAQKLYGGPAPPTDMKPLYQRLMALGGVFVILVFLMRANRQVTLGLA